MQLLHINVHLAVKELYCMEGGGVKRGGGGRERLTAFVPTSDCRFNCHGMIYVSEGKLTFSCWRPLCSVAPLFLSPAGGAIAPPAPPGHHATAFIRVFSHRSAGIC